MTEMACSSTNPVKGQIMRVLTLYMAILSIKARANARNNTQHCWAQQCCLLLRDVSRCVQTFATSHNMLGL